MVRIPEDELYDYDGYTVRDIEFVESILPQEDRELGWDERREAIPPTAYATVKPFGSHGYYADVYEPSTGLISTKLYKTERGLQRGVARILSTHSIQWVTDDDLTIIIEKTSGRR